jgi:glyoxylase-like metal-dependent hydrolase (beta-lactamase superfamily II)
MKGKAIKIISTRVGYSNSVLLVNGSNSALIDTGVSGHINRFKMLFKQFQLKPSDIGLIILTHTHYDHTGNLKALVKYTGAKVLVHRNEYENLKNGFIPIPAGQGTFSSLISKIGRAVLPRFASPAPFLADIINEGEFDLNEFGIEGKIISTPGHTSGSQSVLVGKTLISGDTFVNMKNGQIFPPFANEPKILLETWQKIFDLGVEEIYPGHGPLLKMPVLVHLPFDKLLNRHYLNVTKSKIQIV